MLNVTDKDYFDGVMQFAQVTGQVDSLKEQLDWLDSYNDKNKTRCNLYKDFAPYSFYFVMEVKDKDGNYKTWFNGGLIYHGPHDGGGSGGAPTFSVCLSPTKGWSIHT